MAPRHLMAAAALSLASLAATTAVAAPVYAATGSVSGLSATRNASNPNNIALSWSGTASSYTVTVFADGVASTSTVSGTSTVIQGTSLQTVYNITVSTSNAKQSIVVEPALPGAVTDLFGAPSSDGGVALTWHEPTREGRTNIVSYTVHVHDSTASTDTTLTATSPALTLPNIDPMHSLQVSVTPHTADGAGLSVTAAMGGAKPTAPQGFTATRDPQNLSQVDLTWDRPAWQGSSPITGYDVRGLSDAATWTSVGSVMTRTMSLPLGQTRVYAVRAVSAAGISALDTADVTTGVRTAVATGAAPVVVTHALHTVDVAFFGWIGGPADDRLVVRTVRTNGNGLREVIVPEGQEGVAFENMTNGRWIVTVYGLDDETAQQTLLFTGEITVDNDPNAESVNQTTFEGSAGYWVGVYPDRHRPTVVSTNKYAYEGASALAVTSTWDLRGSNVAVGTGGRGGIPVSGRQQILVQGQGRATNGKSSWTIGVSWWDASGKQIGVARSKRVNGVLGSWVSAQGAFTAPANAVAATPFAEIGGLNRGVSFYIDAVSLKSR